MYAPVPKSAGRISPGPQYQVDHLAGYACSAAFFVFSTSYNEALVFVQPA